MKAVRFHEYGDADVLRLEDVPDQLHIPFVVLDHQDLRSGHG